MSDVTRQLADLLTVPGRQDGPPAVVRRVGTVDGDNGDGTVDVTVADVALTGVPHLSSYAPTVGDAAVVIVAGSDLLVIGVPGPSDVPPSGEAVFEFTGGVQTWDVPVGVETVTIEVLGAAGGEGGGAGGTLKQGGKGGRVVVEDLPVTAGETLSVYVGGAGKDWDFDSFGGWNGGGDGSNTGDNEEGGGGGGGTDVRQGGTALADRVVVAGGGGGAGGNNQSATLGDAQGGPGGDGGASTGQDGADATGTTTNPGEGGGGGTQSAGGAAGGPQGSPTAGSLGQGGQGGSHSTNAVGQGGGGGGGYYGGGGGESGTYTASDDRSAGGGGGGGSNYTGVGTVVANERGIRSGDGQVTITW